MVEFGSVGQLPRSVRVRVQMRQDWTTDKPEASVLYSLRSGRCRATTLQRCCTRLSGGAKAHLSKQPRTLPLLSFFPKPPTLLRTRAALFPNLSFLRALDLSPPSSCRAEAVAHSLIHRYHYPLANTRARPFYDRFCFPQPTGHLPLSTAAALLA